MNAQKQQLLNNIILDLAENYQENTKELINSILDDGITNAFIISKRIKNEDNLKILIPEIKDYVKTIYLRRGTEDVNSLSESGRSSNFEDALEKMRTNIVRNGKRVLI